jgi:hypothetical protein
LQEAYYERQARIRLRELPGSQIRREEARIHHQQNLEMAHGLVSRLEGVPEITV